MPDGTKDTAGISSARRTLGYKNKPTKIKKLKPRKKRAKRKQ